MKGPDKVGRGVGKGQHTICSRHATPHRGLMGSARSLDAPCAGPRQQASDRWCRPHEAQQAHKTAVLCRSSAEHTFLWRYPCFNQCWIYSTDVCQNGGLCWL
jgi:hypothetical protein